MGAEYPLTCGCGKVTRVGAGDAGTELPCGCGRSLQVPELHVLRTMMGEPSISPELEIEIMLKNREVPGDGRCVYCGLAAGPPHHALVECEKQEVDEGFRITPRTILTGMFLWMLLGWLVLFLYHKMSRIQKIKGRHVVYRLPICLCSKCADRLHRSEVGDALRKVEVYRRLLDKYPHASIGGLES